MNMASVRVATSKPPLAAGASRIPRPRRPHHQLRVRLHGHAVRQLHVHHAQPYRPSGPGPADVGWGKT